MTQKDGLKRRFYGFTPVRGLIRQSKNVAVPGADDFSVYEVWKGFFRQLKRTSLVERAAAISFNVFMAIPPVILFVFTLIPYLPISRQFVREIFGLIRDIVPGEKNNTVIIGFLRDFLLQPRGELLSFGLLLALFFSSNAMMGILRSFDKDYEGFVKRTGLRKRRTAIKLTIIVFTTVFACILLLIAQRNVLQYIGIENHFIRNVISETRWVVILFLVFLSVSFIYRYGPAMNVRWHFINPGAVFATSLMILATALVTFWVNNFNNYNKIYGSISAVFILMSLIFVNSLVVLIGFELNVTISHLRAAEEAEENELVTSGSQPV
jgi:membrane protein